MRNYAVHWVSKKRNVGTRPRHVLMQSEWKVPAYVSDLCPLVFRELLEFICAISWSRGSPSKSIIGCFPGVLTRSNSMQRTSSCPTNMEEYQGFLLNWRRLGELHSHTDARFGICGCGNASLVVLLPQAHKSRAGRAMIRPSGPVVKPLQRVAGYL